MIKKDGAVAPANESLVPIRPVTGQVFSVDQRLYVSEVILVIDNRINFEMAARDILVIKAQITEIVRAVIYLLWIAYA